jgi:branched-chain amino acid transport system substrate-binding protein
MLSNFMINAVGAAYEGVPGNLGYSPDLDNPRNKEFVKSFKAKFNRLPTDVEGQAYNGIQVMFEGVKLAKSVKPEDVVKALRNNVTLDTIYGKVALRAADNQLVLPNYVGRVKKVDGVLRQVVEHMKVLVAVKRVVDYNVKVRVKSDNSGCGHCQRQNEHEPV